MLLLLFVHAWATCLMTGLIWFVQIVHYPLFGKIPESGFCNYEAEHQSRTSFVVGPLMLTEAVTSIALLYFSNDLGNHQSETWLWVGLWLLIVNWLITAMVSMPAHQQLARGYQKIAHRRLVLTNWIRTIAWTIRSVLCFGLMGALL